jgi:hypothetical protein
MHVYSCGLALDEVTGRLAEYTKDEVIEEVTNTLEALDFENKFIKRIRARRFFACAPVVFIKLELFVVEDNYYPVASPEVRMPARQDVLLQGFDLLSRTPYIIAMPSSKIPFVVNGHAILAN